MSEHRLILLLFFQQIPDEFDKGEFVSIWLHFDFIVCENIFYLAACLGLKISKKYFQSQWICSNKSENLQKFVHT